MSSNLIRFCVTTLSVLVLVFTVFVVRDYFGSASTARSAAATIDQTPTMELASASTTNQQSAVGAEHFFPPAPRAFEPFLLLLLGSILLSIGTVIKMLLTRKLKQR